jgi:hypothetical protein
MADQPLGTLHFTEENYDPLLVTKMQEFIESVHAQGIKMVLVVSPRHSYGTYVLPAAVRRQAEAFGIPILDFDLAQYREFSDYQLYLDESHLNDRGARLFSRLLGERIKGMT